MGNIDDFVDKLQEQIFDEAREALGEKGFQRWRNPRFAGELDNYNANECVTGSCGDTMEMFFQIQENRVKNGSYITNGCASSSISGSFAVELAKEYPEKFKQIRIVLCAYFLLHFIFYKIQLY